jgi:hypothetical protein
LQTCTRDLVWSRRIYTGKTVSTEGPLLESPFHTDVNSDETVTLICCLNV